MKNTDKKRNYNYGCPIALKGDILVENEQIVAIGKLDGETADKILDASGKYVMPGGVDEHTHFSALCNVGDRGYGRL